METYYWNIVLFLQLSQTFRYRILYMYSRFEKRYQTAFSFITAYYHIKNQYFLPRPYHHRLHDVLATISAVMLHGMDLLGPSSKYLTLLSKFYSLQKDYYLRTGFTLHSRP